MVITTVVLNHLIKLYFFTFSPDEFDIVTNYPKRTLQCKVGETFLINSRLHDVLFQPSSDLPSPPTLKEAGFGKSEMLFVSDLDS